MRLNDFGAIIGLIIFALGVVTVHETVGEEYVYNDTTTSQQVCTYPPKGPPSCE